MGRASLLDEVPGDNQVDGSAGCKCRINEVCALISLAPSIRFGRHSTFSEIINVSCHMQSLVAIHALGEKL